MNRCLNPLVLKISLKHQEQVFSKVNILVNAAKEVITNLKVEAETTLIIQRSVNINQLPKSLKVEDTLKNQIMRKLRQNLS